MATAERSMQVRLDLLVGDYVRNAGTAANATERIATAAGRPQSALDLMGKTAKSVGQTVVSAAGVGVTALAAWGTSAFAAGAAFNTLQQTAGSALVTVLGSAEAASAQMAELIDFSKTSPFPRQLWIEAQQILLGFGFSAESIVPTLSAIQDGMVAVGGSAQTIREVVNIIARISSTGKVTAGDLSELGNRGVDAAAILGEAFGKSAGEIRQSISAGAIDVQTFIDTLVTQMSTKYAGAAEGLRETWVGAFDRIKGATRDFGSILAEPFIDPAGGGAAVQWANDIADAIRALEAIARPAMETLRDRAAPAFQASSEAAQRFAEALREVDLIEILDRLSDGAPIFLAFGAAAAAAGSSSALAAVGMGSLAATINPVAAGVIALALASPELRSALVGVLAALAPLIPPATDLAINLAELAASGVGLAGNLLSLLAPALSVLVSVLIPVAEFASVVAGTLAGIPAPALAAAAGVLGLAKVLLMLRTFTGSLSVAGALVAGFDRVESSAKRASGAIGGLGGLLKGLAASAVIALVVGLANAFDDTAEALERVQSVTSSGVIEDLDHLMRTGESSAGLAQLFGDGADAADGMSDKLRILNNDWKDLEWWDTSGNELEGAKTAFRTLDTAMAEMVANGEDADRVLRNLVEAYDLTDAEVNQLLDLLPQYTAETDRQARAGEEGAAAADEYAEGLAGIEDQAEKTTTSLKTLADATRAQVDPVFAAMNAMNDLTKAQGDYDDAVSEHGSSSQEAREALLELLEAQAEVASSTAEMAEVTDTLPPEMIALAEAAGLSADEMAWLEDQFGSAQDAGEEFGSSIADINADITTSTGQMKVANALAYSGMDQDQANFTAWSIARLEELMAAGWTYEQALSMVAQQSNKSQSLIEAGFVKARDAGLDFSDDYPATLSITGDEKVIQRAERAKSVLDSINRTVTIAFKYTSSGSWRDYLPSGRGSVAYSEGGQVGGPMGAGDVVPAWLTPGEHVWTRQEVDAAGGPAAMEAMRSAVLAGNSRFASAAPSRSAASSMPTHFTADAVIDLGGGVRRVVQLEFEQHDRALKQRVRARAGSAR